MSDNLNIFYTKDIEYRRTLNCISKNYGEVIY